MATKYYALLTNVGAAKLANATALGEQVEITQMAVGDGNGALPTPNPAQTALVHELRRAPLNTLTIDPVNTNQIIAEQVIPEDVGGWWIREIGLYDSAGDLIAIANCAETYKPLLQEGSGRVQVIRVILIVSSTQAVTLKIDPSVVLATRQYVDDQIIQVKAYVDQQLAAHIAESDPHPQYAQTTELTGITGSVKNARMSIPIASKSATFTADEAVVSDGENQILLRSVNKTITLTTLGVGGMDSGGTPASGYVAIYLIYNSLTKESGLLATNASNAIVSEIYNSGHLPEGYSFSALISVWRTDSTGALTQGFQYQRTVRTINITVLASSSTPTSPTALNISSAVPKNARIAIVYTRSRSITGIGSIGFAISLDENGTGRTAGGVYIGEGADTLGVSYDTAALPIQLGIPQVIYYYTSVYAITSYAFSIYCSGYEF